MTNWHEWRDAPPGDYAVVGDPVSHSRSPAMHQAAYRACGLDLTYEAIRVTEAEFVPALDHLCGIGYRGLNCTIPLKELAAVWCEDMDEASSLMGAINTIAFDGRRGTNTDAPALMKTLQRFGMSDEATALVLGAGGTARSFLRELCQPGRLVRAWNRTPGKLESIREELALDFEIVDTIDLREVEVVLNATSAVLVGADLPVDWRSGPSVKLACDVMYGKPSSFLESAQRAGIRTSDGLALLVEQGALAFEWWLGKEAPRADMLTAVR